MSVLLDFYRLKLDKKMSDGKMIPHGQSLILIKREEGDKSLFFETDLKTDFSSEKILFWTADEEVEFIESKSEDWSEEKINERNRYINGEFL